MSKLSHLSYKPPSFGPCQGHSRPRSLVHLLQSRGDPPRRSTSSQPFINAGKASRPMESRDGSPQPCKEMLAGHTLGRQAAWMAQREKAAGPAGGACGLRGPGDSQEPRLRFPRTGGSSFSLTQERLCTKDVPRWGGRPGSCPGAGSGPLCDLASDCCSWPQPLRVSRDRAGLTAASSPILPSEQPNH